MSLVTDFAELFVGRQDAYGMEEGRCFRPGPPFEGNAHYWMETIQRHLNGQVPIGIYPMVGPGGTEDEDVWFVHWGCIDFDEGEEVSLTHARNVVAVLRELEITGWIERSRSKGFHVWVFADSWVPARTMRRALLAACQLVDAPTREINPKQETLGEGQLGNYVRLPYPGSLTSEPLSGARRAVFPPRMDFPYRVHDFVILAMRSRASLAELEAAAELYQEPVRARPPQRHLGLLLPGSREPADRLGALARKVWEEGPLDGSGRGHTLWKLARLIVEDGRHTFDEALELLQDADERWGKFTARGDADYIDRMLEQAWTE